VDTARSRGDAAEYVPLPGVTHLEMITARGRPFGELVPRLEKAFSSVSDVS
jgi:hypothetical protein